MFTSIGTGFPCSVARSNLYCFTALRPFRRDPYPDGGLSAPAVGFLGHPRSRKLRRRPDTLPGGLRQRAHYPGNTIGVESPPPHGRGLHVTAAFTGAISITFATPMPPPEPRPCQRHRHCRSRLDSPHGARVSQVRQVVGGQLKVLGHHDRRIHRQLWVYRLDHDR